MMCWKNQLHQKTIWGVNRGLPIDSEREKKKKKRLIFSADTLTIISASKKFKKVHWIQSWNFSKLHQLYTSYTKQNWDNYYSKQVPKILWHILGDLLFANFFTVFLHSWMNNNIQRRALPLTAKLIIKKQKYLNNQFGPDPTITI